METTGTLTVTRPHPTTRIRHAVAELTFDGRTYTFRYLPAAAEQPGFRPILGFPDLFDSYVSDTLFPLFAQRVLSPTRPDYAAFMASWWLPETATAWQQLATTRGARQSDDIEVHAS